MKLIQSFNMQVSLVMLVGVIGPCRGDLRLLMSVFRHGNRFPLAQHIIQQIYPRFPYNDTDWFPNSPGDLTNKGKLKAFELGKLMRDRYGEWLGSFYSSQLVTFRSDGVKRCTTTALLVAEGLYPPSHVQRWNRNVDEQPIPVEEYSPQNGLFSGGKNCETYLKTLESTLSTDPTIVNYNEQMQHLYDYVSNQTGGPPVNYKILSALGTEFIAVVDVGRELPSWAKPLFYNGDFMEAIINDNLFASWTDELKQWTGGVWIKEWLDHVHAHLSADNIIAEKRTEEEQKPLRKKAYFYGGHDFNIAAILITLGIYEHRVPDYTSAVNFELHDDDNGRIYVKVLHKHSGNFTERIIPGCGSTLCPLNTFKDIFRNVTHLNTTEQCNMMTL